MSSKRMDYIPVELTVHLLTAYVFASECFHATWDLIGKLWTAGTGVFADATYIFFEGVQHAYPEASVQVWATGSAVPVWRYNDTRCEFVQWNHEALQETHTVPYLSVEIVKGAHVHYDLTEFVEKLRVRADEEARKELGLATIVRAWAARAHIVLHPTNFTVRAITSEGDTKLFSLEGQELPAED